MNNLITSQIVQPTFPAQLTTAVNFVFACNGADAALIQQRWGTVVQDIVAPEGIALQAPPLLTPSNEGSAVRVDRDAMDAYLLNDFTPPVHDALMRRARRFLDIGPQSMFSNLIFSHLIDMRPVVIQFAMDLKLLSGEPADTLLQSARVVHNQQTEFSKRENIIRQIGGTGGLVVLLEIPIFFGIWALLGTSHPVVDILAKVGIVLPTIFFGGMGLCLLGHGIANSKSSAAAKNQLATILTDGGKSSGILEPKGSS